MAQQGEAPNLAGIIPHLTIRDRRADDAIRFYADAFGAREISRVPSDDGRLMHAHLEINGGSLMLNDDFPEYGDGQPAPLPSGSTLHLQVKDADAAWTRALNAGASVVMPLEDQFWGDRYGQIRDPFGHRWSIGAPTQAPPD